MEVANTILGEVNMDGLKSIKGKTLYGDVVVLNEKGQLLLLQRNYSSDFEPGKWCLPGGHVDQGEDPMTAAFRELQEETGIETIYGKTYLNKVSRPDSVSYYYHTTVDSSSLIYLDNEEHYRYAWVDMNRIHQLSLLKDLGEVLIDHLNIIPDISANFNVYVDKYGLQDAATELVEIELLLNKGEIEQSVYNDCKAIILNKAYEAIKQGFDDGSVDSANFIKSKQLYEVQISDLEKSHFSDDLIKGKKKGPTPTMGEIRMFGGRNYVYVGPSDKYKTGWKYYGKGTGKMATAHLAGDDFDKDKYKHLEERSAKIKEASRSFPSIAAFKEGLLSAGGSGGTYMKTIEGVTYFVKKETKVGSYTKNSPEQLRQELLSESIYKLMGAKVADATLEKDGDQTVRISKGIEGKEVGSVDSKMIAEAARKEIQKHFVLDCLLMNWDVVGANGDNILVTQTTETDDLKRIGVARIDNGGALLFRAKAGKKSSPSTTVSELDTMRDESRNPTAARTFKGISDFEINKQIKSIVDKKSEILQLIDQSGSEDTKELKTLIEARINDLAKRLDIKDKITKESSKDANVTSSYLSKLKDLDFHGNEGIKQAIEKQIKSVESYHESSYKRHAEKRGISIDAYKKLLQDKVESLMGNSSLFRATDIGIIDTVLNDSKRFKSQFEVGTSHGSYAPSTRASAENKFFGFGEVDHNKEMRPIYGYCSSSDTGANNDEGKNPPSNAASHYGRVTVKIKDSVKNRATVTFGDSLNITGTRAATPVNMPHFTSLPMSSYRDPLDLESTAKWSQYVEIQYHNQLKVDDIDEIILASGNIGERSTSEYVTKMFDIMRKNDIKVRMV